MSNNGELDHPIMDEGDGGQRFASQGDKVDGIIAQTEEDLAGHPHDDVLAVLVQRFREANVSVSDDTLHGAARRIAGSTR